MEFGFNASPLTSPAVTQLPSCDLQICESRRASAAADTELYGDYAVSHVIISSLLHHKQNTVTQWVQAKLK